MSDVFDELLQEFDTSVLNVGESKNPTATAWNWTSRTITYARTEGTIATASSRSYAITPGRRLYLLAVAKCTESGEYATAQAVANLTGMRPSTVRQNLNWLTNGYHQKMEWTSYNSRHHSGVHIEIHREVCDAPLTRHKVGRKHHWVINKGVNE